MVEIDSIQTKTAKKKLSFDLVREILKVPIFVRVFFILVSEI